ncbi:hypothetical protein LTR10_013232 [Elasticomyces elasticus]|uniref:Uncharacterized protein n=1 Tax=Exophiala sideris TaxID=1016849 RepID=A0ABR0JB60_9EURO|nr:hypothetical protein LTR10_013232 [Elasticomyces elasticus]KAK5030611.1 hypothetical protein LTS07_005395 [Exophiala sideris]KAK5038665.1 hypothetical protein LTR13_004412 [Exophiala sideris]KAK5060546.1 hypothetical protein LTR69_005863 [Exophiala sideris]KAK5183458.1 hypothetical protein LTR44_004459 [Eurotiomycetes sp. CCFEE 6388]
MASPPGSDPPRKNPYLSFANDPLDRRQGKRKQKNSAHSTPPVVLPGTYDPNPLIPQDRGLGFDTYKPRNERAQGDPQTQTTQAASEPKRPRRNPWGRDNPEDYDSDDIPSEIEFTSDYEDDDWNMESAGDKRKRGDPTKDADKPAKKQSLGPSTPDPAPPKQKQKWPPYPDTVKGARPADRMLWIWKLEGKSYEAISKEYKKLSGEERDENAMVTRFKGMMEHFSRIGFPDSIRLIKHKLAAEKEVDSELWNAVRRRLEEDGEKNVSVRAIKKLWQSIPPEGWDVTAPEAKVEFKEKANQGGLADMDDAFFDAIAKKSPAPGGMLVGYESD